MPPITTTYRLQLRREFTFRDAAAVVPYVSDLGVSHVYCSPVLQAVPGSAHGYDVIDHSKLSDDLGGDEGWAELVEACDRHDLGLVIDIVPNHMAWPAPESSPTSITNSRWLRIQQHSTSSTTRWSTGTRATLD